MRSYLLHAAVLVVALTGCQDKSKKPEALPASSDAALAQQPATDEAAVAGDVPGVPDDLELLVRKTQAHAHRVTEEMQRSGTLEEAASRPPAPSVVEWMKPDAYRLGLAPEALPAPETPTAAAALPAVPPAVASETSTANTPVAIDESPNERPRAAVAMLSTPIPALPAPAGTALERQIEKRVLDYPKDVAAQLDFQLLQFIQGKPAPDLSRLAALPDEDQEILTAVIDGLANFRNAVSADPNLLLSRKVKPLIDAGERLRARADLEIPVVELCRRVDGYGVYEPIEHKFIAGQDREVIVYCEVENFMSQFSDKSQWETRLSEEVVLYTDNDGLPILRDKPTPVADLCRNRRSDFFIVRKIRLPGNIPVGRYWLKVTVVDQLASRVAEHSIPITFVAK